MKEVRWSSMLKLSRALTTVAVPGALAAVALLGGARTASAQGVQFAGFTLGYAGNSAPAAPFQQINNANARLSTDLLTPLSGANSVFGFFTSAPGAGGTTVYTPVSVPVTFNYNVLNGYSNTNIASVDANMTLFARVQDGGTGTGSGYVQTYKDLFMSFTAVNAVNGNTNLLTVSSGATTNQAGAFQRSATSSTSGNISGAESADGSDTVIFTSDFLNFNPPGGFSVKAYSLTFTSINPSLPAAQSYNDNGYLRSFATGGAGVFSSDPIPASIPEPGSLLLMAPVAAGVALRVRTRRRKAVAK
jgi:hypothetical protein